MPTETTVRDALRSRLLETPGARSAVDEFWVPRSHERADIALIGRSIDGFEIKTERDTLRRLPRQAAAYGRLFDRCTAVIAGRHVDVASAMLPEWWGVTVVEMNGSIQFRELRKSRPNPAIEPDTLVRLLWRDEAIAALQNIGLEPDPASSRGSLWAEILRSLTVVQLRSAVRRAILARDPARARIGTRRFRSPQEAAGAGR